MASTAYKATPDLERELQRHGQVSLQGGAYRLTIARGGPSYYEAWTDSLPFVYGPPATTLQGALDALDEVWRTANDERRAS